MGFLICYKYKFSCSNSFTLTTKTACIQSEKVAIIIQYQRVLLTSLELLLYQNWPDQVPIVLHYMI